MGVCERFWAKVPERPVAADRCWLWAGAVTGYGYGKLYVDGRYVSAHRVAVELDGYEIPPGLIVMHTCDTRACVRPTHLIVGTYSDNHRDSMQKGRWNVEARRRGLQCRWLPDLERVVLSGRV